MNQFLKGFCLCVVMLFFLGTLLEAQQTGEIRGKVTTAEGEALPGVAITAKSASLQGVRTAISDRTGNFRLPLLPVGTYALTFELDGFEKLTLASNNVLLGFTTSLSVSLKVATVLEEITVTAPAPLIDKTRTDTSYRLNSDDLARIPAQARTIAEVVGLTPGVTGARANTVSGGAVTETRTEDGLPSFRGEGDAGNNWLIDGLPTKGAVQNDPGVRINYDSWEEIQIISDTFAPEMGQGLGGFINIVTKSGGNDFHGELGGLIRDRNLRAQRKEQLSVATLPETSMSQYFGNLGGPILKDKLWFFISDNYFRTLDKTAQQSVSWLTIPAGERHVGTNNAFGKVTFTPFKNHTFSWTGTLDKYLKQTGGIGVPETYTKTDYTDYSYRLNYRGILSADTLLTAVWGQNRRKSSAGPLDDDFGPPAYFWQDIAQTTNNAVNSVSNTEWRTDFTVGLTKYLELGRWGNHELKAGWSYYNNKVENSSLYTGQDADPWSGNGFDNGAEIFWSGPGIPLRLQEMGISEMKDSSRGFGFYAEDNLTIGRFSLMLGLRSDTQKIFNDSGENVWSWGLGDFLQPRVSLAVDISGDGRNVLKFGYGRFAMPLSLLYLGFVNKNFAWTFREYDWAGPNNPSESELKDPANWTFVWEQSGEASPIDVDPQLKPNKTSKFLLEFDRQLLTNWALKVRAIYSYANNLLEDIGLYDPAVPSAVKFVFTNFELKKRDYRAFEIELNGRVTGKFSINASYTWSQAKGSVPGNIFEASVWSSAWGGGYDGGPFGDRPFVPVGAPEKDLIDSIFYGMGGRDIGDEGWYGFLPYSVDHIVKILGTYFAPYGIVVSTCAEYLSGYHWEKKGWSDGYGDYYTFPEGRGGRTTPAHMYLDLSVEKNISLKRGMTLGLGLNAYNLFNSQRPISFVKEDTSLFGQTWARQLPRWLQLKVMLRF